jgi:hypothetical protein
MKGRFRVRQSEPATAEQKSRYRFRYRPWQRLHWEGPNDTGHPVLVWRDYRGRIKMVDLPRRHSPLAIDAIIARGCRAWPKLPSRPNR